MPCRDRDRSAEWLPDRDADGQNGPTVRGRPESVTEAARGAREDARPPQGEGDLVDGLVVGNAGDRLEPAQGKRHLRFGNGAEERLERPVRELLLDTLRNLEGQPHPLGAAGLQLK